MEIEHWEYTYRDESVKLQALKYRIGLPRSISMNADFCFRAGGSALIV